MKKVILCLLLMAEFRTPGFSQNLLPFVWKISFTDTIKNKRTPTDIGSWKEVNLLLSWERQGYFNQQGACCLSADFIVPPEEKDSTFILSISLQCLVKEVYLNGHYIGGNLPNQFWSKRGAKTDFLIPKDDLYTGKKNRIEIFASDLSYTGGISHNSCTLRAQHDAETSEVKLSFTTADHRVSVDDQKAALTVHYRTAGSGVLAFCIKSDFHDTILNKSYQVSPGDSLITIPISRISNKPGFYECVAVLNNRGFTGDAQWFTISPEKIVCQSNTVQGFDAYWHNTLNELNQINPDFKMHKADSLCTASRDAYIIEMKSLDNLTVRGYYFVPKAPGKYPALLHVPGYGWGYQNLDSFLKNTDQVIELALCVRGHGISSDIFHPGFGIPGIWGYELCSEEKNAYRGVYMDCVRAVDFLLSRPEVDRTRIGVLGGSQGGGLTLVTAGLCNDKISACAYFDPFPCDIRDFVNIREVCQTEIQTFLKYYHHACSLDQAMHVQDLINTKSFASWITCPVYFATALFDDDCPPHVGFAAYNAIKTAKRYKIYPNDSHLSESGYEKDFMAFFKKEFRF